MARSAERRRKEEVEKNRKPFTRAQLATIFELSLPKGKKAATQDCSFSITPFPRRRKNLYTRAGGDRIYPTHPDYDENWRYGTVEVEGPDLEVQEQEIDNLSTLLDKVVHLQLMLTGVEMIKKHLDLYGNAKRKIISHQSYLDHAGQGIFLKIIESRYLQLYNYLLRRHRRQQEHNNNPLYLHPEDYRQYPMYEAPGKLLETWTETNINTWTVTKDPVTEPYMVGLTYKEHSEWQEYSLEQISRLGQDFIPGYPAGKHTVIGIKGNEWTFTFQIGQDPWKAVEARYLQEGEDAVPDDDISVLKSAESELQRLLSLQQTIPGSAVSLLTAWKRDWQLRAVMIVLYTNLRKQWRFKLQHTPPRASKKSSNESTAIHSQLNQHCAHPFCQYHKGDFMPEDTYRLVLTHDLWETTKDRRYWYSPEDEKEITARDAWPRDKHPLYPGRGENGTFWFCLACVEDLFNGVGMIQSLADLKGHGDPVNIQLDSVMDAVNETNLSNSKEIDDRIAMPPPPPRISKAPKAPRNRVAWNRGLTATQMIEKRAQSPRQSPDPHPEFSVDVARNARVRRPTQKIREQNEATRTMKHKSIRISTSPSRTSVIIKRQNLSLPSPEHSSDDGSPAEVGSSSSTVQPPMLPWAECDRMASHSPSSSTGNGWEALTPPEERDDAPQVPRYGTQHLNPTSISTATSQLYTFIDPELRYTKDEFWTLNSFEVQAFELWREACRWKVRQLASIHEDGDPETRSDGQKRDYCLAELEEIEIEISREHRAFSINGGIYLQIKPLEIWDVMTTTSSDNSGGRPKNREPDREPLETQNKRRKIHHTSPDSDVTMADTIIVEDPNCQQLRQNVRGLDPLNITPLPLHIILHKVNSRIKRAVKAAKDLEELLRENAIAKEIADAQSEFLRQNPSITGKSDVSAKTMAENPATSTESDKSAKKHTEGKEYSRKDPIYSSAWTTTSWKEYGPRGRPVNSREWPEKKVWKTAFEEEGRKIAELQGCLTEAENAEHELEMAGSENIGRQRKQRARDTALIIRLTNRTRRVNVDGSVRCDDVSEEEDSSSDDDEDGEEEEEEEEDDDDGTILIQSEALEDLPKSKILLTICKAANGKETLRSEILDLVFEKTTSIGVS